MSVVGRRCPMGCETWPDNEDFSHCLNCGEPTRRTRGAYPTLSEDEATKRLREAEFEAWCVANDRA